MLLARFLSLRYWLRHRGAFFLSMIGIALGIAVFVAIQVANYSVLSSFGATLDAVTGKANLQIVGGHNGLPDELLARIRAKDDPRIQASAPLLTQTRYSPTLKSSLLILGIDVFSEPEFRDYGLKNQEGAPVNRDESAPPTVVGFLTDPRAIALSRSLAQRHNLKLGSEVLVYSGAQRLKFKVVRILEGDDAGKAFGGDFALLDIAAAQEAFSKLGHIDQIDFIVDENQIAALTTELKKLAPPDAIVQRPAQRGSQVRDILAAFQLNLSALSCISLFVGAFLIYNAIAISVVRRRVEVGTLRALGASRGQLLRLFLAESAAIGLVGSIIGFGLGLLLARYTLAAVSTTVSELYIAVRARQQVIPAWLWWGAPLGGTVLSVISAIPPALEAANTSPRAALQRGTFHQTATRAVFPMALAGVASLLFALFLCQPWINKESTFAGFAATFFTLGGFALFAPLVTLRGGRLVYHFAGKLFGIEVSLAGSYLQRALGRSSLVIAALMVSLAMSIGMSVMVRSFRTTVATWIDSTISADLYIAPATGFSGEQGPGLPREVIDYARSLPQLRTLEVLRNVKAQIGNFPVRVAANELPGLKTGERHVRFLETVKGEAATRRDYETSSGVLVSERFKSLTGLGAGKTFTLNTPSGPREFFIDGVFYDYTPDECLIYMPRSQYIRYWHDTALDTLALYLEPGTSASAIENQFQRRFSERYQLTMLQNAGIRATVMRTFDQTFAVTYALQLIAIIVAAVGIFDTLLALLLERARELATLRSLGASGKQIMKMTLIEFLLIGVFAWGIGMAAGLCVAWQFIYVINRQFFGWTIEWTLPVSTIWQSLLLALLAALGSGWLPARAAARRHIADSLQTE